MKQNILLSFTTYFHSNTQNISERCNWLLKNRISHIVVLWLALDFENIRLNGDSWDWASFVTDTMSTAGEWTRGRRDVLKISGTSLTSQ